MKIKKIGVSLLLASIGSLVLSCQGVLDLRPIENSEGEHPNLDFNFMYRINSTDTVMIVQDSLKVFQPVLVELYLLPFDTLVKDRQFFIAYNFNDTMDADLLYDNRRYRANDLISVRYSKFVKQKLYMSLIPLNKGKMDLFITCTDESGISKNYRRAYVVLP